MANKLYPPYIEGTLPAFFRTYDNSGKVVTGAKITVPFSMNSTVGETQIKGFSLRMRTTSTGSYLFAPIFSSSYSISDQKVDFYLTAKEAAKLNEGQYYKVQIAYCSEVKTSILGTTSGDGIGFYSTVGVIKCTSEPTIRINNLDVSSTNFFVNDFIGIYDQTNCKDQTEKVYSYEFIVYNDRDEQVYTTGEQLHHSFYDTEYDFSIDKVSINNFIPENKTYSIQYKVTTINNLQLTTPKYKITNENLISPNEHIQIIPIADEDNGTITVTLKGELNKNKSYYFLLDRNKVSSEISNGLYIQDYSFKNIFTLLQESLEDHPNELVTFLKDNTLYKKLLSFNEEGYKFLYVIDATAKHSNNDSAYVSIGETLRDIIKTIKYSDADKYDPERYDILREEPYEKYYYGSYLLSRSDDSDDYSTWVNLGRFRLDEQRPSSYFLKDFTIEHGRKYKYALQQYNVWGLFSSRFYSEAVEANFEDMYLYDGEKTLKIRYNPNVNTFKTTVLESKSNTLGGRYPFITRNGETYYKEFSISGLLAQELDIENCFSDFTYGVAHRHSSPTITEGDLPENAFYTSRDFSDTNIALQRQFKLNVLDWLNNGKPKLFKSPYEGNYIIRLMQNSMTPVKELGRLLHNFTSMAYEIADFNYENLVKFGFIHAEIPSDYVGLWKTYNFADYNSIEDDIKIVFDQNLIAFTIQDMMPGDKIYLKYYGDSEETSIMIGITGSYSYIGSDKTIIGLTVPRAKDGHKIIGTLNCYYKGVRITAFDSIIGMQLKTIPSQQFIGVSPYLVKFKTDPKYTMTNNEGINQFTLEGDIFQELQAYNFRDQLNDCTTMTGNGTYRITNSEAFQTAVQNFNPENILDRINLTLNAQDVYKIQLLNIEQARFRLREIIPVYAYGYGDITNANEFVKFNSNDNQNNRIYPDFTTTNNNGIHPKKNLFLLLEQFGLNILDKSYPLEGQKRNYYDFMTSSNYHFYVSMSPFGYPFPIEELQKIKLLDPYAIFEVFYKTANVNDWQSYIPRAINSSSFSSNEQYYQRIAMGEYELYTGNSYINDLYYLDTSYRYYDPYYRTWLVDDYKPTFTINNSDPISLVTIKEKFYKNAELKNIESITIGNGIVAELTFQIKVMDYYTEISDPNTKKAKDAYLAARDLYNSLLKSYSIIATADYERIRNQALMRIYYELLFGAGTARLTDKNRDTINTIFKNQTEINKLNLLKLYKVTYINKDLDIDIVEDLVEYKNKHNTEYHFGFNEDMLVYKNTDQNNVSEFYFLQSEDIKIYNGEDKDHLVSTIEFNRDDFVTYLQSDTLENTIFFAIPKTINDSLTLEFPYYYYASEEDQGIQFTGKNDNVIVYQLLLLDNYANQETKEELLDEEEYMLTKENRYYLYDKLVSYETGGANNPITFFEKESIYDLTKIPDIDGENGPTLTEGVAAKLAIVTTEIEQFNSLISALEESQANEISNYKDKYMAALELVNNYNKKVYFNWSVYTIIDLLLNQYLLVPAGEQYDEYENYYTKDEQGNYIFAPGPLQFQNNTYYRHYNRSDIIKTFSQDANEVTHNLDNQKFNITNYAESATDIYNNTLSLLENIKTYDKITGDRNDDTDLDDYFNEQIKLDRGQVLFNALALYYYINIINNTIDLTENEQELKRTIQNQYNYLISAMLEERQLFQEGFKYLGKDLYNTYITKYNTERTYIATDGAGKRGVAGLSNMIDMSKAYDDLKLILNTPNSFGEELLKNNDWNEIKNYIFSEIIDDDRVKWQHGQNDPIDEFSAEISNYTSSNATNFNITKGVYLYRHRRELILSIIGEDNNSDIPPNPLKTFIFNPISEIVKDPLITNANSNKAYFDSITNINMQVEILKLNLSLIEIILNIIEDTGTRLNRQTIAQNLYEKYLKEDAVYNSYILAQEHNQIMTDKESALVALNSIIATAEETLSDSSTIVSILGRPIQQNGKWSVVDIPDHSRDDLKIPDGIVIAPYLDVLNDQFDNKLHLVEIPSNTVFENSFIDLNEITLEEEKNNVITNSIDIRQMIYNFTYTLVEMETNIKACQDQYRRAKELYDSKKNIPNYYDGPISTAILSSGEAAPLEISSVERIKITNTKITVNNRQYDIWYSSNQDGSGKQKVTENGVYNRDYKFYYSNSDSALLTDAQILDCGELITAKYKFKNTSPVTEYYIDSEIEEGVEPIKIQCNTNTEYPYDQVYYHFIYTEDPFYSAAPAVAEILQYKEIMADKKEILVKDDDGLLILYLEALKNLKEQYSNILNNNIYHNWFVATTYTFPFITTLEELFNTRASRELETVMLETYNYTKDSNLSNRLQYLSNFFKNYVIYYYKDNNLLCSLAVYNNIINALETLPINNLKALLPEELTKEEYIKYYNNLIWYNYENQSLTHFLNTINTEINLKNAVNIINLTKLNARPVIIPQSLVLKENDLIFITQVLENMELDTQGVFYEYLQIKFANKLDIWNKLLEQATILKDLYQKQYDNYSEKYAEYNNTYTLYQDIYNSYANSKELEFYLGNTGATLEDQRLKVKRAWWNFLNTLDYAYTQERARGLYQ